MPAPYRKKLIEVALPLEAINVASAREKSIRHGHPSTLHLWWARRPLAACRAVLFASLVDDPESDPHYQGPSGKVDEDRAFAKRTDLFALIEELVQWENSNNPDVIHSARAEIARCVASRKIELGELPRDHEFEYYPDGSKEKQSLKTWDLLVKGHVRPVIAGPDKKRERRQFTFDVSGLPPAAAVNAFLAEHAPPVLDPFCGGGSIPLEAQRLGLRAYGTDLNPVPVLITKALIEIPGKFAGRPALNPGTAGGRTPGVIEREWHGAQGLAADIRFYGQWLRDEAEKRVVHLYPRVKITAAIAEERPELRKYIGTELTVIAWLHARTVASSSPLFHGIHVPLIRDFWLSKKPGKLAWLEPEIDRNSGKYTFTVRNGTPNETERKAISAGTKVGRGCKFKCILSNEALDKDYIKAEGCADRLRTTCLAVVAEGQRERVFLPASAAPIPQVGSVNTHGIDVDIADDKRAIWCLLYGLRTFDSLFTRRQLAALTTFSDLVGEVWDMVLQHSEGDAEYADAIATYLAFIVNRVVDRHSSIATWDSSPSKLQLRNTFARQGIPMSWDFADGNPFSDSSGTLSSSVEWVSEVIEGLPDGLPGKVSQLDAAAASPQCGPRVVSTDPPYYDNIGYADLSDFFYVWLRRALGKVYPTLFPTVLTPKTQELIASPYRHGGLRDSAQEFFEEGFGQAFRRMRHDQHGEFPLTVYYAFKQSETASDDDEDEAGQEGIASTGWETMLAGLIRSGFSICGTWPIRTELGHRMVGSGANALASSVVLVCRPRESSATMATTKELIAALRKELPSALEDLRHGNIAPVDLAQAAIGPGMAVFTRYSKVLESNGTPMSVRTALELINQTLDEVLVEQEGEFDGDTRWALAWFEQFGTAEGPFGVAETLSKAKNTAVNGLVEAGVIVARGGKVRLVKRDELPEDWSPTADGRLTIWETTQHLIRTLEQQGESAAADLLRQLGGVAETARDLAYRLYTLCERKKWAEDALAYNGLVIAWPELTKLARAPRPSEPKSQQKELL